MITPAQQKNAIENYAKTLCATPEDSSMLIACQLGICEAIIGIIMVSCPDVEEWFLKNYGEYM